MFLLIEIIKLPLKWLRKLKFTSKGNRITQMAQQYYSITNVASPSESKLVINKTLPGSECFLH